MKSISILALALSTGISYSQTLIAPTPSQIGSCSMITGRLRDLEAVPLTGTLRHIEVAFTGSGQARSIIQTIQAAGYTVLANEFSTDPNHLRKGFFVFSGAKGTESEAFFVQDAVRQSCGGGCPDEWPANILCAA
jgi:hypothetical protein